MEDVWLNILLYLHPTELKRVYLVNKLINGVLNRPYFYHCHGLNTTLLKVYLNCYYIHHTRIIYRTTIKAFNIDRPINVLTTSWRSIVGNHIIISKDVGDYVTRLTEEAYYRLTSTKSFKKLSITIPTYYRELLKPNLSIRKNVRKVLTRVIQDVLFKLSHQNLVTIFDLIQLLKENHTINSILKPHFYLFNLLTPLHHIHLKNEVLYYLSIKNIQITKDQLTYLVHWIYQSKPNHLFVDEYIDRLSIPATHSFIKFCEYLTTNHL